MTATLLSITLRQLFSRRRAILIALLAIIPVAVALLYRFGSESLDDPTPDEFTAGVIDALIVTGLLPLGALIFGTGALGAEIEDGTAVYLLSKPIPRSRIFIVKVLVAFAATFALATPTTMLTAFIALGGDDPDRLVLGFGAGVTVGALAYCAVFVALSAVSSRALIFGLIYVFVWEAFIGGLFSGTRWVSIRQYVLGIADGISDAPASLVDADLGGTSAAVSALVVVAIALVLGVRFLDRFEIGERI